MVSKAEKVNSCNETDLQAWLTMSRVYEKMQKHASEHLQCYELTPAQYDVLAQLEQAPGLNQQELADQLLVTKGNICTLMDRMEKRGLVERRDDPEDRRQNQLYLTELGSQIAAKAVPAYGKFVREHLAVLSDEEQKSVLAALNRLEAHLDTH